MKGDNFLTGSSTSYLRLRFLVKEIIRGQLNWHHLIRLTQLHLRRLQLLLKVEMPCANFKFDYLIINIARKDVT